MKKSLFSLALVAGTVLLIGTGCSSIETNRVGSQVQVNMPVTVKPTIETKDQVITGSATVHSILGIFTWGPNAQAIGVNYGTSKEGSIFSLAYQSELVARNAAAYNATSSAKADIILAPQYVLTTEDYFFYKSINCKVKGFPGFIKSVKVVDSVPAGK